MRSIALVTSTRADYSLLRPLIARLSSDSGVQFHLLVTGTHLSEKSGMTVNQILADGFTDPICIPTFVDDDSPRGLAQIMSNTLLEMETVFARIKPELLVLLGDRFEILAVANAALLRNIPIAHIHGGEATWGLIDDAIRHSLTKMSHLHFASTEDYKNRIIQMGEHPERVFKFGAPALELMEELPLLPVETLAGEFGEKFLQSFALVTFHPVTLEPERTKFYADEFFAALAEVPDLNYIITAPNVDTAYEGIVQSIAEFHKNNSQRVQVVTSLGPKKYFSLMKVAKAVLGNSSSGIIEAPFYKVPTVDVGDRQKGRIRCESVLSVKNVRADIVAAVKKSVQPEWIEHCQSVRTPYYQAKTSQRIVEVLKTVDLKQITQKTFYDLKSGTP